MGGGTVLAIICGLFLLFWILAEDLLYSGFIAVVVVGIPLFLWKIGDDRDSQRWFAAGTAFPVIAVTVIYGMLYDGIGEGASATDALLKNDPANPNYWILPVLCGLVVVIVGIIILSVRNANKK